MQDYLYAGKGYKEKNRALAVRRDFYPLTVLEPRRNQTQNTMHLSSMINLHKQEMSDSSAL